MEKSESKSKSSVSEELGEEIKKAIEKKGKYKGNLWSGVAKEIQEIEWPFFGKVLGITGVVIGIIVGSSVVLIVVNNVLAKLAEKM